jgi:hypothetical protein
MIWVINDRALLDNAFIMSDVPPIVPGAVPDFVFIMALVTSSSGGGGAGREHPWFIARNLMMTTC